MTSDDETEISSSRPDRPFDRNVLTHLSWSETGKEIFVRFGYSVMVPDKTRSLLKPLVDDLRAFESLPWDTFVREVSRVMPYRDYRPLQGTWCEPIEDRGTILSVMNSTHGGCEEWCCWLRLLRSCVVSIHGMFLKRDTSIAGDHHYRLRTRDEVNWDKVNRFFSVCDMFLLRSPRLIEYVTSVRIGHVQTRVEQEVGNDIMLFICNFANQAGQDETVLLEIISTLCERDKFYIECATNREQNGCEVWADDTLEPFVHRRDRRFGSAANFYRNQIDRSPSSHSDSVAGVSKIFRFLREEFRAGAGVLYDEKDDYGQIVSDGTDDRSQTK